MDSVRVWGLLNHRAGENGQILALTEALRFPFEIKRFHYRPFVPYLALSASLLGIDPSRSSPLEPPWPDIVITASARNEPIAFWIKKEAAKDGQEVKIVHIGRPWQRLEKFDLIITTPQYRLPKRENVLHNQATLYPVFPERLAKEAERFAPLLQDLPRPWTAVLIGGSSGPYVMDKRAIYRLGQLLNDHIWQRGGSLLITTSARTPEKVTRWLEEVVVVPYRLYRWQRNDPDNPYFAFLGLADEIVVTADSASMLTEACATRKPVYLFDFEELSSRWPRSLDHLRGMVYRFGMRWAPQRLTRDLTLFHRNLIEERRVVPLGGQWPKGWTPPPLGDLERAVMRVRQLLKVSSSAQPTPVGASSIETVRC